MEWLIGLGLWGLVVLFIWALCVVAGRADDAAERMHGDVDGDSFHALHRLQKGAEDEEVR